MEIELQSEPTRIPSTDRPTVIFHTGGASGTVLFPLCRFLLPLLPHSPHAGGPTIIPSHLAVLIEHPKQSAVQSRSSQEQQPDFQLRNILQTIPTLDGY